MRRIDAALAGLVVFGFGAMNAFGRAIEMSWPDRWWAIGPGLIALGLFGWCLGVALWLTFRRA